MFNINEILIIMALPTESQGLFEKAGIPVHYSGIGKVNAAFKTAELIFKNKPKRVINLGTAGSHKFNTHTLIECHSFVQKDMDITPLGFRLGETPFDDLPQVLTFSTITELQKGICGTGDIFETGLPKLDCDLVDMEAFAIAKVCRKMGVDLTAIKYISDGNDHNSKDDWVKNLRPAAENLLKTLQGLITK